MAEESDLTMATMTGISDLPVKCSTLNCPKLKHDSQSKLNSNLKPIDPSIRPSAGKLETPRLARISSRHSRLEQKHHIFECTRTQKLFRFRRAPRIYFPAISIGGRNSRRLAKFNFIPRF